MSDGFTENFEFSSRHDDDLGYGADPKRAWVTPELEELVPGTERYERAVAAFREAAANNSDDGEASETDQG